MNWKLEVEQDTRTGAGEGSNILYQNRYDVL